MYLRFSAAEDARYAAGHEGKELKVAFTPPASISPRTFELTAILVRCTANGVGVAFRESPRDATRVLHKVAIAARAQRIVADLHPERGNEGIREAAQALLSDAMEVAVQDFGESIADKLSAASVTRREHCRAQRAYCRRHANSRSIFRRSGTLSSKAS